MDVRPFSVIAAVLLVGCSQQADWKKQLGSDPMTDRPRADVEVKDRSGRYVLAFSCSDGKAASPILVAPHSFLIRDGDSSRMISYRVDKQAPQRTVGYFVDDMLGFHAGSDGPNFEGPILAAVRDAKMISFKFDDPNGEGHEATFDIAGAGDVLDEINAHCGAK